MNSNKYVLRTLIFLMFVISVISIIIFFNTPSCGCGIVALSITLLSLIVLEKKE